MPHASNENRVKLTEACIKADFKPKGKYNQSSDQKMITKETISRLEGSFGTGKEYFLLNQIKTRTQKRKFLGIYTSNTLNIEQRMSFQKDQAT